jgi:hypothetical protein
MNLGYSPLLLINWKIKENRAGSEMVRGAGQSIWWETPQLNGVSAE